MKLIFILLVSSVFNLHAEQVEIMDKTPIKRSELRTKVHEKFKCSVGNNELSQLKEFFLCQSSVSLGSCGLLGAYIGGRVVGKAFASKMIADLEKNKSKAILDITQDIYNSGRAPHLLVDPAKELKRMQLESETIREIQADIKKTPALVSTQMSVKNGVRYYVLNYKLHFPEFIYPDLQLEWLAEGQKSIRAALRRGSKAYLPDLFEHDGKWIDFNNLSPNGVKEHIGLNKKIETVYDAMLGHLKDGKPLDKSFKDQLVRTLTEQGMEREREIQRQTIIGGDISKIDPDHPLSVEKKRTGIITEAMKHVDTTFNKIASGSVLSEVSESRTKAVARLINQGAKGAANRAGKLAFLAVGGGSLVAEAGYLGLTYSKATGCSSFDDKYLNAQGGDCTPTVGLSEGVLAFLNLPPGDQEDSLNRNDSQFCEFYKDLYDQTFSQSISQVSCLGRNAEVKMYDKTHGEYTSYIHFRDDGSIDKIASTIGSNGSLIHQLDKDGNNVRVTDRLIEEKDLPLVAKTVQANKLYAQEIASCCQSTPSEQEQCLRQFNASKIDKMLDGSNTKSKGLN